MAKKKGICKNVDGCDLAAEKTIQEAESSQFVCSECGKPLFPVEDKKKTGGGNSGKTKIIAGAVAALALIGGGSYFALSGGGDETDGGVIEPKEILVESLTVDNSSIILKVGETADLLVRVSPENNTEDISTESSDPNIVTVDGYHVSANKAGSVQVVLKTSKSNKSATVDVTVERKDEPGGGPGTGKVNISYGFYEGPLSGGKPDGFGGSITVTSSYTIDLKKASGETVTVNRGDKIMNVKMENGRLRQGEIHFADGTRKYISGL